MSEIIGSIVGIVTICGALIGWRFKVISDRRANYDRRLQIAENVHRALGSVVTQETSDPAVTSAMMEDLLSARRQAQHVFPSAVVAKIDSYIDAVRELRNLHRRMSAPRARADDEKWAAYIDRTMAIDDLFGREHKAFDRLTHRQMNLNFWPWTDLNPSHRG